MAYEDDDAKELVLILMAERTDGVVLSATVIVTATCDLIVLVAFVLLSPVHL